MGKLESVATISIVGLIAYVVYRIGGFKLPEFKLPELAFPTFAAPTPTDVTMIAGRDIPTITFIGQPVGEGVPLAEYEAQVKTTKYVVDLMESAQRAALAKSGLTSEQIKQSEFLCYEATNMGVNDFD